MIGGAFVIGLGLFIAGTMLPPLASYPCWVAALAVVGFTLYFFRDPARTPPVNSSALLLAPADGKVVVVADLPFEPLYLKGPARQVSIFLSPLNVHVNRSPADGVIEYDAYVPGDYLVAWHPKASERNERSQLGLRHPSGTPVLFKQIAGAVARRIVYHVTVGDTLHAGQRFGIVKFGSRMDILVPPSVRIDAQVGDRVRAGETVIGHIPGAEASAEAQMSTASPEDAPA